MTDQFSDFCLDGWTPFVVEPLELIRFLELPCLLEVLLIAAHTDTSSSGLRGSAFSPSWAGPTHLSGKHEGVVLPPLNADGCYFPLWTGDLFLFKVDGELLFTYSAIVLWDSSPGDELDTPCTHTLSHFPRTISTITGK